MITIWQLELLEKGDGSYDIPFASWYFLTYRGAKRMAKKHEREWKENSWSWRIGGEPLFLF